MFPHAKLNKRLAQLQVVSRGTRALSQIVRTTALFSFRFEPIVGIPTFEQSKWTFHVKQNMEDGPDCYVVSLFHVEQSTREDGPWFLRGKLVPRETVRGRWSWFLRGKVVPRETE
jgi:hypothetical protein